MKPIRRILHVEDNLGDASLLREALNDLGASVELEVVQNGVRAIEYLHLLKGDEAGSMPDLILLDINMPVMDGFTLLRVIQRHSLWSSVPVVMLTSSHRESERQRAADLGAAGYMVKPPEFDGYVALARRIRRFPNLEPTPVQGSEFVGEH